MTLEIRLLGDFSLQNDGAEVYDVHRTRLRSFLAYVALYATTPLSRRQVAFTFWPDSPEGQARNNLRKLLYDLRQALPRLKSLLRIDANTIHWHSETSIRLDVAAFDDLLEQAGSADPSKPAVERALLDEAIALYGGDLLPSCYDEWIVPERERLRQAYLGALERLMLLAEGSEDYSSAVAYANQQLIYDPLRESTYRRLMRFYAFLGDRASALRVYHACVSRLEEELGVEPGPEIEEAYARVLDRDTPAVLGDRPSRQVRGAQVVGREREWWTLLEAWDKATAGTLHLCLIRGEAGIGKSRLVQELLRWVGEQGLPALYSKAYEQAGALAYTPLIDWLQTPPLQAAIRSLDDSRLLEIGRLLPDLLSERPNLPRPEPISERWQRQRLFDALTRAILACRQPLLLVLDDGQWCDPDTLAWLHYLLEQSTKMTGDPRPAILLVCTARPEEMGEGHPLTALAQAFRMAAGLTELDLPRLSAEQTVQLATTLQPATLNVQSERDLYTFTEGNPLFIVETLADEQWHANVRAILPDPALQMAIANVAALPPKLHAVIHARLTRLAPDARHLAVLTAVIGRAFDFDMLRQASGLDENAAMLGVDELWRQGILREQADGRYDFSHDRIRDVAYAEISPVQRPLLHRRVAQALEARYAENLDSISGQLGLHYELAGERGIAIDCFDRAAEVSTALFAHREALLYTDRALALLPEELNSDETIHRRIDMLMRKQRALAYTFGATSAERKKLLDSVYSLSQKSDSALYRFRVLMHMRTYYGWRGDIRKTAEITPDLLALAQSTGDPSALQIAHWEMADFYYWQGKFASALEQTQLPVITSHIDNTETQYARYAFALDLRKRMLQTQIIWLLGYPDRSLRLALDEVRRVNQEDQTEEQITVYSYYCALLQYLEDRHTLRGAIARLKDRCRILVYRDVMSEVDMTEGWFLADEDLSLAGLEQLTTTLRQMQARGSRASHTYWLWLLALAQRKLGKENAALDTLHEAYLLSEELGDFHWRAEIHRLTGDVQMRLGYPAVEIENSLQAALDVSRRQGAKSLELRAAMSMARFWQSQGKTTTAHALLSEIFGWFTEGFDTPDLQTARALLTELSHTSS